VNSWRATESGSNAPESEGGAAIPGCYDRRLRGWGTPEVVTTAPPPVVDRSRGGVELLDRVATEGLEHVERLVERGHLDDVDGVAGLTTCRLHLVVG
jgi:hypothetical protein